MLRSLLSILQNRRIPQSRRREAVPTRAEGIDRCPRWPKIALPAVPWIRLAKSEGTI